MILEPGQEVLEVLVAATGVLLALALLFAAATLLLRGRNALASRRWRRREAAWTPLVLDVLAGDRSPQAALAAVSGAERPQFAAFLTRFARRLKGAELDLVRTTAEPLLDEVARRATRGSAERRARALQTLGDLGQPRHLGALVDALDDPSPLVAMTATRALAQRRHVVSLPVVLAKLHRFEDWSYVFLASVVAAFGPEAAPALRRTLADDRLPVGSRIVAAEALRDLHDLPAADAAVAAAASRDVDLAAAALRLLAAIGGAREAETARRAVLSREPAVRAQACAALATLGGPEDHELLLAALDDPSPWVVLRAAQSLKKLGGEALTLAARAGRPPEAAASRALAE